MADLKAFHKELRDQHAALTTAFEAAQATAEKTWADYEAKRKAITEFRSQYGAVLKALDAGAVKVKEG